MSYSWRRRIYPALGKEAEVRAQMTDWVTHLQGQGRDINLLSRIFSSEGAVLVVNERADELAAIEQRRQAEQTDADFRARAAKVSALVRAPARSVLLESIVPIPAGGPPPGIVRRATCYPTLGKERQVRSILEEYVTTSQHAGLRWGLFTRIYSSDGSALEVTTLDADLAALDRVRRERAQLAAEVLAAIGELSRAPIEQRLFEVAVSFATS